MKKRVAVAGVLVALLIGYLAIRPCLFLVLTDSMPRGLYFVTFGETPRDGEIAFACVPILFAEWAVSRRILTRALPESCNGYEPVIKRVVARSGDRVRITDAGVMVNDRLVPGTARQKSNPLVGMIPHVGLFDRMLGPPEAVLVGDNRKNSFDSRYFGPVERVLGRATLAVAL